MMTSLNGNNFRVTGPLCGEFPVPVNSPHKGQWRGALKFSLICVWINVWVNNREAGDLRHHRGHYDVTVMCKGRFCWWQLLITFWSVFTSVTPSVANDNKSALAQGRAWCRTGDTPLPEPMIHAHFYWWKNPRKLECGESIPATQGHVLLYCDMTLSQEV